METRNRDKVEFGENFAIRHLNQVAAFASGHFGDTANEAALRAGLGGHFQNMCRHLGVPGAGVSAGLWSIVQIEYSLFQMLTYRLISDRQKKRANG